MNKEMGAIAWGYVLLQICTIYNIVHFAFSMTALYAIPLTGIARIMEVESGLHGRQLVESQHRDRKSACASLQAFSGLRVAKRCNDDIKKSYLQLI
jgi:hypothetical protein